MEPTGNYDSERDMVEISGYLSAWIEIERRTEAHD